MSAPPHRPLPLHWGLYLFGIIQSGLTTLIATGVVSSHTLKGWEFMRAWASTWPPAWCVTLPVVLLAAPVIKRIVNRLTGAF